MEKSTENGAVFGEESVVLATLEAHLKTESGIIYLGGLENIGRGVRV